MKPRHRLCLLFLGLFGALTACAALPQGEAEPESISAPTVASTVTMNVTENAPPVVETQEKTEADMSDVVIPDELEDACVTCGGEVTVRLLWDAEIGPTEEECISCIHGTDEIYMCERGYQLVCQNPACDSPYKSHAWTVSEPGRRVCHGW